MLQVVPKQCGLGAGLNRKSLPVPAPVMQSRVPHVILRTLSLLCEVVTALVMRALRELPPLPSVLPMPNGALPRQSLSVSIGRQWLPVNLGRVALKLELSLLTPIFPLATLVVQVRLVRTCVRF